MGNLIAYVEGTGENRKKLMFAAHIDEIGFIVTHIEDNGYIRFSTLGGINMTAAAYSEVTFENGLCGILVPDSGASNPLNCDNCSVDIGTKSKRETELQGKARRHIRGKVRCNPCLCGSESCRQTEWTTELGAAVMIEAQRELQGRTTTCISASPYRKRSDAEVLKQRRTLLCDIGIAARRYRNGRQSVRKAPWK